MTRRIIVSRGKKQRAKATDKEWLSKASHWSVLLRYRDALQRQSYFPFVEKHARLLVIAFMLIALSCRFYNLGYFSFADDELINALGAKNILNGKPPVENNALTLTYPIAGLFALFGESEFVARVPSVLCSVASIWLVYVLGRRLFNRTVGVFSALFLTFSVFEVSLSRLARYYAIFQLLYVAVIYLFFLWFEVKGSEQRIENTDLLKKRSLSRKHLILLLIALILCGLTQPLTIMFVFSLICYVMLMLLRRPQGVAGRSRYLWLAVVILGVGGAGIAAAVLSGWAAKFYGVTFITTVVPKWEDMTAQLSGGEWFHNLKLYISTIVNDYRNLWWLGIVGVAGSFLLTKDVKRVVYLLCCFLIPFLLYSFVFVTPNAPRYLFHVYPLCLLSMAVGAYSLIRALQFASERLIEDCKGITAVACVALFALFPFGDLRHLTTLTEYAAPVYAGESLTFYNWRAACHYVSTRLHQGDIIWASMSHATDYYLGLESLDLNRASIDGGSRRYDFQRIVEESNRGWVIVDPRRNTRIDRSVNHLISTRMKFHYDASSNDIAIFSWDSSSPEPPKMFFLPLLWKDADKMEFSVDIGTANPDSSATFALDCEAIDSPTEAICIINRRDTVAIPSGHSDGREEIRFKVPMTYLTTGKNSVRFMYSAASDERRKGWALYGFKLFTPTITSRSIGFDGRRRG